MATRATGHLEVGVFIARQRPWHGDPLLPCSPKKIERVGPGGVLGAYFALSLMLIGKSWTN
jgi:hypothetical protein